jgi:thiosulfate/3-mercaptopyruvate sulfurtransferase
MNSFRSGCVAAVLLVAAGGPARAADLTVTPAWLTAHLSDPALVVLHVGDRKSYDAGHIPGARFLDFRKLSDPDAKLRLQMPPVDRLKAIFEGLGVSDASRIVLYFPGDSVTGATRTYLSLDYLGLGDRTSLLDGGEPGWRTAGHPVTTDAPPEAAHGTITVEPHPDVIVDADWVKAHLTDPSVKILDARDHEYYTAETATRMPRQGHIAGAANVPFDTLTEGPDHRFKSPAVLRQMLETAGAKPGVEVATYCHIGLQASALYFVAKMLGYPVHLYDGSFEEWSARQELPIER